MRQATRLSDGPGPVGAPVATKASSGRAAFVYVGLSLGQRAVSFLLIPFLTSVLTTAEYGTIAALTSLTALLTIAFGLSLEIFVLRRAVLTTHEAPTSQDHAAAWYLRVVVPLAGIAIGGIIWASRVHAAGAPSWALASAVAGAALQTPLLSHALPVLRGRERFSRFATLSLISIAAQTGFTLGLIVVAHLAVQGWAMTNVLAGAACWIASWIISPVRFGRCSWKSLGDPLRFTGPLLPHQMLIWVLAFVDRVIMIAILGASVTGLYSLAYQASTVAGMAFTEFNRALMPRYTRLGRDPSPNAVRALVREHVGTMTVLVAVALPCVPLIAPFVFHGAFGGATKYVGPLLISQLLYGLYNVPTNLITLARGQSRRMWSASGAGAAINVVLNLVLLRTLGAWGGVIANVVAYGLMLLMAARLERSEGRMLGSAFRLRATLPPAIVVSAIMSLAACSELFHQAGVSLVVRLICAVTSVGLAVVMIRGRHGPPGAGRHRRVDGLAASVRDRPSAVG